jgi:hypothetical protein
MMMSIVFSKQHCKFNRQIISRSGAAIILDKSLSRNDAATQHYI